MNAKTNNFIKKAKLIHGEKYDYSKVDYVRSTQPVVIVCPIHGEFTKSPNNHLSSSQGCQKCVGKHRPSTEEFITRARHAHGDLYDYTKTQYGNSNRDKVTITCRIHGDFVVTPANHINNGVGCKECAKDKYGAYHKKDTDWFITRASVVHKLQYDYSLVNYQNIHTKVKIICKEHGVFEQTPASHIHNKNGCPKCSCKDYEGGYGKKRFENHPEIKDNPAKLYVITLENEEEQFIKVGITQKDIVDRFERNNTIPYEYSINKIITGTLYEMFILEQQILKEQKHLKYKPQMRFNGHTECLNLDCKESVIQFLSKETER